MRVAAEDKFIKNQSWLSDSLPVNYILHKKSKMPDNTDPGKEHGTSSTRKFRLLMWKNLLLQRRKKKQSIFELFFSIVFCILLVVIRDLAPSDDYPDATLYEPFDMSELPVTLTPTTDGDFFSTLFDLFTSGGGETARKKRDLSKYTDESISDSDVIYQLPKVKELLKKNPNSFGIISKLIDTTRKKVITRKNLFENHSNRSKIHRSKRNILTDLFSSTPPWPLAYTPNNTAVMEIMKSISEDYLYVDIDGYGFQSEHDMVKQLTRFSLDPDDEETVFFGLEDILGAIVFTNEFPNDEFPNDISYKIRLKGTPRAAKKRNSFVPPPRWNTEVNYPLFQVPGPRIPDDLYGGAPGYYDEGFLAIQYAVDRAIGDYFTKDSFNTDFDSLAQIQMQRFPYPPYIDDKYLVALQAWLPLILILSFLYPAMNIVKGLVYEKEQKLKESMKMMGLDNWLHWAASFTKSIMMLTISTTLITILLCVRWMGEGSLAVLDNSDPSLVFIFIFVYSIAGITFCFFLSTLFSKANSASSAAGILWIMSYLPNIIIRPQFHNISLSLKLAMSLYFNTALSLGCFLTSMLEGTGNGLQWHLIHKGVSPDSPFSMGHVLLMFLIDIWIYSLLTWYIEAVFPGEFGVPQPFYFPFTRSYWFGTEPHPSNISDSSLPSSDYFEPDSAGLNAGIRIKGLTKRFAKNKIAVKEMNLNMYGNQITVLLGHNGAGKTTTMSMLTGLFPPTSGTAEVNGYDIVKEMRNVRTSIGICPQHDVLFDDLTVAEHLQFFSELKGMRKEKIGEEIQRILSGVKLLDKRDALAKTLSGGMKRKLSVGIALCAHSHVVILDEPTTGMDPGARRLIWDLLQRERNGRTILLTTHFMEEADLLGDRIAIMADGVIQCCGSSMFLKRLYGAGYHLTLVKKLNCDVSKITEVITTYIPNAKMELNIAAELTYILPSENVSMFEALFRQLEDQRETLNISSYGASQTTMEEVFLKVGEANNPEQGDFMLRTAPISRPRSALVNERPESHHLLPEEDEEASANGDSVIDVEQVENNRSSAGIIFDAACEGLMLAYDYAVTASTNGLNHIIPPQSPRRIPLTRNTGIVLYLQQFWAMFTKKALYSFRNFGLSLVQTLVPIFFLIIAMVLLRVIPGVNDTPPNMTADLNAFEGTITTLQSIDDSDESMQFSSSYVNQFKGYNTLFNLTKNESFIDVLLEKAMEDLPTFNLDWMTGVMIEKNPDVWSLLKLTVLFNNQPYHVPPVALNLADQALLQTITGNKELTIKTSNHPLPRTDTEKLTQESRQNIGFNIGFNLAFGMSFMTTSFILFVIRERSANCKHLQFVSGASFVIYWFANALWDFLCFSITASLIVFCLFIYQEEDLSEGPQLGRIYLILLSYAWSIVPFIYICSFLFTIPASGYTIMTIMHIFTGIATYIIVTILRIPDLELSHIADILDWVFLLLPPYALASAIGDVYSNIRFTKICNRDFIQFLCGVGSFANPCCRVSGTCGSFGCLDWTTNIFAFNRLGIGRHIFFLVMEGVVFFLVLAMIEMKVFRKVSYLVSALYYKLSCNESIADRPMEGVSSSRDEEDDDVRVERLKIQNSPLDELFRSNKLVFRELKKVYKGKIVAVDHLNLGVPLGECFGLLGINGAGKTTTFKMLTGDLPVSFGDAYVNGFSVKSNIKKVQQQIGYCPQFDAILDQLTGRETLRMFARLRGIPEGRIEECIDSIASQLIVTQHLNKQVGSYSGGNKRKLSTGIALIGDPPLVLLDEPTSGMDPVARRHLWDVLNSVRDSGRSIILTSHSMEECEALCTRIAIMTNGSFRCLGSPQQLKSKFSEGYSIILRVKVREERNVDDVNIQEMPEEMSVIHNFILKTFKESYLREMQWGRLEYFIPCTTASWSQVFGVLERSRHELDIDDYSVTQTTLERVFLNFTRGQRPEGVHGHITQSPQGSARPLSREASMSLKSANTLKSLKNTPTFSTKGKISPTTEVMMESLSKQDSPLVESEQTSPNLSTKMAGTTGLQTTSLGGSPDRGKQSIEEGIFN